MNAEDRAGTGRKPVGLLATGGGTGLTRGTGCGSGCAPLAAAPTFGRKLGPLGTGPVPFERKLAGGASGGSVCGGGGGAPEKPPTPKPFAFAFTFALAEVGSACKCRASGLFATYAGM